jgi:PhzF family phenazine biosynthesis protein
LELPYYIVDAFTREPFGGNPAAVVLDAHGLSDELMQKIAMEFNLSETTFVLPPTVEGADLRFRWFTPLSEVRMCGHATIGGVHVLLEAGRLTWQDEGMRAVLKIETLSGVLDVTVERLFYQRPDRLIWLSLPDPVVREKTPPRQQLAEVFQLVPSHFMPVPPIAYTADNDIIALVTDVRALNEAQLNLPVALEMSKKQKLRGICLATTNTLAKSITVQSRFFAPAFGIMEDPVTGSVHGPLAAHLVKHKLVQTVDGVAALNCVQGIPGARAGFIRALCQQHAEDHYSVRIAGEAVTVMQGTLHLGGSEPADAAEPSDAAHPVDPSDAPSGSDPSTNPTL